MIFPEPLKHVAIRLFQWAKAHKVKSVLLLVGAWLFIEVVTLPFGDIGRLKSANPIETAFMREHAQRAKEEGKSFKKLHRWVPLSRISKDAVNAIIVAEDFHNLFACDNGLVLHPD